MARTVKALAAEVVRAVRSRRWPTATLRAQRRRWSKRLEGATSAEVLGPAFRLLREPEFEFRFVAYEIVANHPAARSRLDARTLERLAARLGSWGAVDTFACSLAGPAWREGRIGDAVVHRWARSPDRWWRRAALVATVPLNSRAQGGAGDSKRTLAVCRMLVADRDDMVVKAMSWALRELAKRDASAVRGFLAGQGDASAARVRREVRSKLETGLKNPRIARRPAEGRSRRGR